MQKTAYELRISDWSLDVCSSDLTVHADNEKMFDSVLAAEAVKSSAGQGIWRMLGKDVLRSRPETGPGLGRTYMGITRIPRLRVRAEERRVGEECVGTCRYRVSPYH